MTIINTPNEDVRIFDTKLDTVIALAQHIYQLAEQEEAPIHIALSGGSTPSLLFQHLAEEYAQRMPWSKLHFWWGDERCVPPTDAQSNYGVAKALLLSKVDIPAENIHRVHGEWLPEKACAHYANELETRLPQVDSCPVFNLIILGMGDDGHTASIFPQQLELMHSQQNTVVAKHPDSGQRRVSITGRVINSALEVVFLITGSAKAAPLRSILQRTDNFAQLPTSAVKPHNAPALYYIDEEAASLLAT